MIEINADKEFLLLSNDFAFYTLEGEGRYVGYPSVFLRTSCCNLSCKGFASKDSPFGCDSYVSWSIKNKMSFNEIALFMEERGYHTRLKDGALLKLTGGEPLLWQKQLLRFVKFIHERWGFAKWNAPMTAEELSKPELFIDFETNGTIMPDEEWYDLQCSVTYTTSPKLSSNGDPADKRYKPEVLKYLVDNDACFKFVVKQESDLEEVFEKYVNAPDIKVNPRNIWIMPMCGSREELLQVGPVVADLCKKYNFKFSNRMHLQLWNLALKV